MSVECCGRKLVEGQYDCRKKKNLLKIWDSIAKRRKEGICDGETK